MVKNVRSYVAGSCRAMSSSIMGRKAWKGYANEETCMQSICQRQIYDYCCRFFTFWDSHCKPSKSPSPVVAQLKQISNVKYQRYSETK